MSDSDLSDSDVSEDEQGVEAVEERGGFFGTLAKRGIICAKEARTYGVNDKELSKLKCTRARNPYHRGAAALRLYETADVVKLAKEKQVRTRGPAACPLRVRTPLQY